MQPHLYKSNRPHDPATCKRTRKELTLTCSWKARSCTSSRTHSLIDVQPKVHVNVHARTHPLSSLRYSIDSDMPYSKPQASEQAAISAASIQETSVAHAMVVMTRPRAYVACHDDTSQDVMRQAFCTCSWTCQAQRNDW